MTLSELETAFDALPVGEKAQFAAYAAERSKCSEPQKRRTLGEFLERWKAAELDPDFADDLEKANRANSY